MNKTITHEYFTTCTGRPPKDDDLERANCSRAGEMGHFHCGWDDERNLPRSQTQPLILDQPKWKTG